MSWKHDCFICSMWIIMSYLNLLFSRLGVAAIMTRQNTAVITANTRQTETRKLANHKETLSDRCWFCLYFGLLTFGKRLRMSGVDLSIKHTSFCLSLHHDFYLLFSTCMSRPPSCIASLCLDKQRYNNCLHKKLMLMTRAWACIYIMSSWSEYMFWVNLWSHFIATISRDPFCLLAQW